MRERIGMLRSVGYWLKHDVSTGLVLPANRFMLRLASVLIPIVIGVITLTMSYWTEGPDKVSYKDFPDGVRIAYVDDDTAARELVTDIGEFPAAVTGVVDTFATCADLLYIMMPGARYDVYIIDTQTNIGDNGYVCARKVREFHPDAYIIGKSAGDPFEIKARWRVSGNAQEFVEAKDLLKLFSRLRGMNF